MNITEIVHEDGDSKAELNGNGRLSADIRKLQVIRSNGVTEFLNSRPSFIVRSGILILCGIALLLLATTYFIQYPDVVHAKVKLQTVNAPKEITVKSTGRLTRLFVKEGDSVKQNQVIGYMESTASPEDVIRLYNILTAGKQLFYQQKTAQGLAFIRSNIPRLYVQHFGELQNAFQRFHESYLQFNSYADDGFYMVKKQMLGSDITQLKKVKSNLEQQMELRKRSLALENENYNMQKTLAEQKVSSPFDLRREENILLNNWLTIPESNINILNNEQLQHERTKEIKEIDNQREQQYYKFLQEISTMISLIEDWKNKYLLVSPLTGAVSFSSFFQENQEIKSGSTICFIVPDNTRYYAECLISQYNLGKIRTGQQVIIKLESYPYAEFGTLKGTLEFIHSIPTDSGYFAKIALSDKLITTYNKDIFYRTGLKGNADILTRKKSLLTSFLENMFKNIRNN